MTPLTFDDLLLDAAPPVRPLAEATRALVVDVLPDDVLETSVAAHPRP